MLRNKVVVLLLVGVALFAVYRNYTFFRDRHNSSSGSAAVEPGLSLDWSPSSEEKQEKERTGLSAADRIKFSGGMGRDPFGLGTAAPSSSAVSGQTPSPELLKLSAILLSPRRRLALMNGAIYQEGDFVGSRKILRIEDNRIILSGGGDGLVVELEQRTGSSL